MYTFNHIEYNSVLLQIKIYLLVHFEKPALAEQRLTILGVREHTFHFRRALNSLESGTSTDILTL